MIYGGTTSKTLAPALRLGWMALPAALIDSFTAASGLESPVCPVPVLEQLALAELLRSGAYDRHVRRMRQRYRSRRDELLQQLAIHAPRATTTGIAAGLHAVIRLPDEIDEASVLAACHAHQVAVRTLSDHAMGTPDGELPRGIVVGYGTPAAHAFPSAIDALARALSDAGLS